MTKRQQLLSDLHSVEVNVVKKEKDFDTKTHLIKIFRILSGLFEGKEDVSKEDIVDVAKRESRKRGIEDKYNNWNEIFGLEEKVVQGVKKQEQQLKINSDENTPDLQGIAPLSSKPYPDNFHVGQAVGDESCFFDSFRQGLEQQIGTQVTVEQLRDGCREFAQNNPPEWFTNAIANSYDNNSQRRNETVNDYVVNIMRNDRWGDPEVEGRILCGKYGVKLHVVEDQSHFKFLQREVSQGRSGFSEGIQLAIMNSDSNGALTQRLQKINSDEASGLSKDVPHSNSSSYAHHIIDSSSVNFLSELPTDSSVYNDQRAIHIINNGESHFEPLLDRKKSLAKQEQEDFLLAKKLQLDEILEYCNISKDSPKKEEVEKTFDELLAKNADGKISDVVEQCISDIKQRIQRSEEQSPSSLPSCGMKETKIEKFDQQQTPQPMKSC
ncbi:MAG: hypothetical protein LBC06_00870 [Rickettsiales bacterium]|jgi:hypothetical protein|nr:hypothetical protein [Rickettsiales bacterium]